MEATDLHLEPNEASDLALLGRDGTALARHGWDRALVTVLDEAPAEQAIALLLHAAGERPAAGWSARRLKLRKAGRAAGKTEDAEACARRDGMLYVLGSQFGSKDGPLEPKRSWAARVREDEIAAWLDGGRKPRIELARLRFALHRAVNDALLAAPIDLLPLGPQSREAYIDATIARGAKKDKKWAGRVKSGDHPINVEACEFRAGGRLLLGLRYPVAAGGRPLLVELDDVDDLFGGTPFCSTVWVLDGPRLPEVPLGLRALGASAPDHFHAVLGNLDSTGKGATVLADHPAGAEATSLHVEFSLPAAAAGGPVECTPVHDFGDLRRVEGIAVDGDEAFYVVDRDGHIGLGLIRR